jgi:hypothetical protein
MLKLGIDHHPQLVSPFLVEVASILDHIVWLHLDMQIFVSQLHNGSELGDVNVDLRNAITAMIDIST